MNPKTLLLSAFVILTTTAHGQEDASAPADPVPANEAVVEEPEDDGFVDPVQYSAAEKKSACAKYNGRYIAYYDAIYKIEKCKYREVQSSDEILRINKLGVKILPVDGDILAKLERGVPIEESNKGKQLAKRGCSQLEKRYVTYVYSDVYYIDSCKKRVFPDWTTFVEHRKKFGRQKDAILALTYSEFTTMKNGEPMPSFVEAEFQKQAVMGRNVDVISLDVACKGLNGKDVSYVDQLYRIENCRKRAYDVESFLKQRRDQKLKLVELTSEQWISLPDGKPMTQKKK